MLAALAYSVTVDAPVVRATTGSLAVLVLIYWLAIRLAGQRFHQVQRTNLELQFSNAALIASLTEKTRAAMLAVDSKNRFIANATHDLRQPVHALGLYADWLQAEPEFASQIAPKIVQSTRAVNELFNSLFDLAKLDASAVEVRWQQVDLPSLMAELELQYVPLAQEKGLTLRTRVVQAQVWSDRVLLKRLLGNLLSNAIRHTGGGGVLLAVRQGREGSRVEVWDTGIGIPADEQTAIFEEFYRVARHNGTEDGFGLGLAIVSRLCEALQHPLSVRSRVGRGTVFRLEFPALQRAPQAQSTSGDACKSV
jgi:signal transduction histidine kinase